MDNILDVRTLSCPEPMMLVRSRFRKTQEGVELEVHSDDPRTPHDLKKYCLMMDNTFVSQQEENDIHGKFTITTIKKGKS